MNSNTLALSFSMMLWKEYNSPTKLSERSAFGLHADSLRIDDYDFE